MSWVYWFFSAGGRWDVLFSTEIHELTWSCALWRLASSTRLGGQGAYILAGWLKGCVVPEVVDGPWTISFGALGTGLVGIRLHSKVARAKMRCVGWLLMMVAHQKCMCLAWVFFLIFSLDLDCTEVNVSIIYIHNCIFSKCCKIESLSVPFRSSWLDCSSCGMSWNATAGGKGTLSGCWNSSGRPTQSISKGWTESAAFVELVSSLFFFVPFIYFNRQEFINWGLTWKDVSIPITNHLWSVLKSTPWAGEVVAGDAVEGAEVAKGRKAWRPEAGMVKVKRWNQSWRIHIFVNLFHQ